MTGFRTEDAATEKRPLDTDLDWDDITAHVVDPLALKLAHAIKAAEPQVTSDSRVIALSPNSVPAIVLGSDATRVRALIRANTSDVMIGSLSTLQAGLGYTLPTASGDELRTQDEVYAIYVPSGAPATSPRVELWVERKA